MTYCFFRGDGLMAVGSELRGDPKTRETDSARIFERCLRVKMLICDTRPLLIPEQKAAPKRRFIHRCKTKSNPLAIGDVTIGNGYSTKR